MTTDADGRRHAQAAMREQPQERSIAGTRTRQWKWSLGLGLLWVALAVNYWRDDDGDPVLPWLFTGLAVLQLGTAAIIWWRDRNESPS